MKISKTKDMTREEIIERMKVVENDLYGEEKVKNADEAWKKFANSINRGVDNEDNKRTK